MSEWPYAQEEKGKTRRCFKRCKSCGSCENHSVNRVRCANCEPVVRCRCGEGTRIWLDSLGRIAWKPVAEPGAEVRRDG